MLFLHLKFLSVSKFCMAGNSFVCCTEIYKNLKVPSIPKLSELLTLNYGFFKPTFSQPSQQYGYSQIKSKFFKPFWLQTLLVIHSHVIHSVIYAFGLFINRYILVKNDVILMRFRFCESSII